MFVCLFVCLLFCKFVVILDWCGHACFFLFACLFACFKGKSKRTPPIFEELYFDTHVSLVANTRVECRKSGAKKPKRRRGKGQKKGHAADFQVTCAEVFLRVLQMNEHTQLVLAMGRETTGLETAGASKPAEEFLGRQVKLLERMFLSNS